MFFESYPDSTGRAAGASFGEMVAILLKGVFGLFGLLFLLHAGVGYVELGTDSWISKLAEDLVGDLGGFGGTVVLAYASLLMCVLRWKSDIFVNIVGENPLLLLAVAANVTALGLFSVSMASTVLTIFAAITIFGLGKAFLWPTMLSAGGQLYPRAGSLVVNALGAAGMLCAGVIAGPVFGYLIDGTASQRLTEANEVLAAKYVNVDATDLPLLPPVSGIDTEEWAKISELVKEEGANVSDLIREEYATVNKARIAGSQKSLNFAAMIAVLMNLGYLAALVRVHQCGGWEKYVALISGTGATRS